MKLWMAILVAVLVLIALVASVYYAPGHGEKRPQGLGSRVEWQRMANPGELSQAHAFLDHNCNACHTPMKGAEAVNCIVCHANNDATLQRQPTSFHADIGRCRECHGEHEGRSSRVAQMDHETLAKIGLQQLKESDPADEISLARFASLDRWIKQSSVEQSSSLVNPNLSPLELTLDCSVCHRNDDRHFELFGNDCSTCHEASKWSLPEFRHPSARSMDCAQCHQAPPSHYMMHFKMISATVANQPHARVDQCFLCHQTTSWIDIQHVGPYKHH